MSAELVETAAEALGPLLPDLVFLGGASIHLWISDPAAPDTRTTNDVDVISAVAGKAGYYRLSEQLRKRGFNEASNSTVICRWNHHETGLILDVMPADKKVLGFSNQWYEHAIATSIEVSLANGKKIRAATPPSIVATKLAAWHGRGNKDMLTSLDLHDIIILIDGREELIDEIGREPEPSRYISRELDELRKDPYFTYLIESALHGYGALIVERAAQIRQRINAITSVLQ